MRDADDVDVAREGEVERGARPKAVPDRAEPGHALRLECADDRADELVDLVDGVLGEPGGEVERGAGVEGVGGDRVALEEVGHDDFEAVARKVVGEQLQRSWSGDGSGVY